MVIEALENLNQPSTVHEIIAFLNEHYHNDFESTKENTFRSLIQRTHGVMSYEKSIYGLKKWEKERGEKGGSTRDIVYDLLIEKNEIINLNEVFEYVIKHREVSSFNHLKNNLLQEQRLIIKGNFIGVKNRDEIILNDVVGTFEPVPTEKWQDRYNNLVAYLNLYKKLPSSTSADKKEVSLRTWYGLQMLKWERQELKQDKTEKWIEIFQVLDNLNINYQKNENSVVFSWEENYEQIISYLKIKKSISGLSTSNSTLYGWYHRQMNKYKLDQLNNTERILWSNLLNEFDFLIKN